MELFATDNQKLDFLLEAEALLLEEELHAAALADEEVVSEELPPDKRPKYITNYIGSKQKLTDWIWRNTPEEIKSVFDAFSGSAVVGYMYKTKGLKVVTNDRLRFAYHAARAIIENNSTRLSAEDIENLTKDNPKASDFVQKTFKGIFFASGVLKIIDNIRANIDTLYGYKKDIALLALGRACLAGKGGFGHFSATKRNEKRSDNPKKFNDRFANFCNRINALVFDNGKENKAHNQDIMELAPKVNADLAYFDPPYATHFSTTNYEKSYHFLEGLMTYWKDKEINKNNKARNYITDSTTVTQTNAQEFFTEFLSKSKHIKHWLISYRDHAYPSEAELKKIVSAQGKSSRMKSRDHTYSITSKRGEASHAKERLFICSPNSNKSSAENQKSKADTHSIDTKPMTTEFPVEIGLKTEAEEKTEAADYSGDKRFGFVLCHAGTNKNGDHFTVEELSSRYQTAVNQKINLKHSQDITDIVGGIVASDFVQDGQGERVECVGELYTQDNDHARLGYKLMKKGIITQVSMECDYMEGECSICGKKAKRKGEYCIHLKKYKAGEYNGKAVYEILHGITFTGLGLLDKKGADENARITTVSELNQGGNQMADEEKKKLEEEGKKAAEEKDKDQDAQIKQLQEENQQLKQQVADLQKQVEKYETEAKTAARKARAEKLINKLEQKEIKFNDQEREAELKRLSELNDDAFAATEAAYDRMLSSAKKEPEPGPDKDKNDPAKTKADSNDKKMRTDAGVTPLIVDDKKSTLEDKLKNGFMAAYQDRVDQAA